MNWNDKAEQMKQQKELIELALNFNRKLESIKNAISELEDHAENFDRTDDEIKIDQNLFKLLETLFDCKSMQVLFHDDMTKAERVSYFFVAVELLEQIYRDLDQEPFAEVEMLKRLFQFSKKTGNDWKDLLLDEHSPFSNSTYL